MNVVRIMIVAGMLAVVAAFTPSPGAPGESRGEGSRCLSPAAQSVVDSSDQALTLTLSRRTGRGDQMPIAADVRFETVDVYVDSGDKPLAAYQFVVHSATGNALLAGLEGGEHAAFSQPPYYDPKALIDEKVIVAAFSTADNVPQGRTRVARLHVQVTGDNNPEYIATLQTAAGPDGAIVPAKVTVESVVR